MREPDDQCRVLVIEDNSDIAAYIGSHLMDRYAVSYADNGVEGMKRLMTSFRISLSPT